MRHHRLWPAQGRSSARTFRSRVDPGTVHREIAAYLARDVRRRFLDLLHAASMPRAVACRRRSPRWLAAAPAAARGAPIECVNGNQREGGRSMMSHIATATIGAALALAATTGSTGAQQDFPSKPVQLMVAYPAGGSTDIAARIVAAIAEKSLGQPIVVVNKGGAGGQVGWTELVRQRPDGYYLGFINLPATNTVILDADRKAIFTEKDFTPIINQVLDPGVI